jgi:sarcosine oxidase subunit beta
MRKIFVPETEDRTADAVVIGGGIVGTATAFWLSKAGLETILVEAREGLSTLTTAASAECFRAQFTEPSLAPLARESITFFEHFAENVGLPGWDIGLRQQGYLFITDDEAMIPDLEAAVAQHHKLGVTDSEVLTGEEVRSRFPFISPKVVGATFRQKDGWLSCHEVTQGFAKGASARFFVKTKATDIFVDGKGVCGVQTTRGRISTRVVVNAAGPFAGVIGRMVGLDLPLEPVRRQKVFIASPVVSPGAPFTVDLINDSYWRPESGGALMGWVDAEEPVTEPMENPMGDWDFPAICLDKVSRLTPFFEQVGDNLKKKDINVSAGQYVYTPDNQPIIGPVDTVPGFYLNCGYWIGVMVSPMAGKRTADLVTGNMDNKDNLLRFSRYEEGIDMGGGSFLSGR